LASQWFLGREEWVDRIARQIAGGHDGQPFLFAGPSGLGKEVTALEIARRVNCAAPGTCRPEQPCESCVKAVGFQHPDIRWIGPAPAGLDENGARDLFARKCENPFYQAPFAATAQISVGDPERPAPLSIRALIRFFRLQAFQARYKVAVVVDAHRMNAGAANAFLKTLEEPPPRTLIFMTSSNPAALLPTVLSRCQKVPFLSYTTDELAGVLAKIGTPPKLARPLARRADGNARKAVALLRPEARAVDAWAGRLLSWIHAGKRGDAHLVADQLHAGVLPADMVAAADPDLDPKALVTKELGIKRERALQLCEMLNLYYSEALACLERSGSWEPRVPDAEGFLTELASSRKSAALRADIMRVERTKSELDRNLNIGLCMAVLFEDLIDHAQRDRRTSASG
jgi:DNA polymerase III delta prime subunit